ncbi:MAG: hypothetical protein K9N11_10140 [Lentisphaeria bacterium]|nr:hypothetical protein [Candidatus Neomarinimicrobiota bacterium]MCF7843192.1 hypothetical protein [Lentisphaeria bacterium]
MRSRITVGESVYIGRAQLTGESSDVVTLAMESNQSVTLPIDSVTSWEISMQNGPGSYVREGVLVGMVGALLGGLTGLAICDRESEAPTYGCFLAGAIYYGAPVILLAPLIGATIEKPEEWAMIYRVP